MKGNPLLYFMVMVAIVMMLFIGITLQAQNNYTFGDDGTIIGTDTELPEYEEYQDQNANYTDMELKVLWGALILIIVFMVIAAFHFLFGKRRY